MSQSNNFAMIKNNVKKGRKRSRTINVSRKPEIYYLKQMLAISKDCAKEGAEILKIIEEEGGLYIGDSAVGDAPAFLNKIARIVKNGVISRVAAIAGGLAGKVVKDQKDAVDERLSKRVKLATDLDLRDLIKYHDAKKVIESAVAANISNINSLPIEYHAKLEKIFMISMQTGKDSKWIREEFKKLENATEARARLIVTEQISLISAKFEKDSQQALGIDEYIWISREDARVRGNPAGKYPRAVPSHHKRHGKVMSWQERPSEDAVDGFPGEPPRCRCEAYPYFGE